MLKNKTLRSIISGALLAAFCTTSIISPAFAAGTSSDKKKEAEKPGTHDTKMVRVVEHFINGSNEKELAPTGEYSEEHDRDVRDVSPAKIDGYIYKTYHKDITNIYMTKDIPYIVGYPDKTVRPLRFLTRAEATAIFHRLYDGNFPEETRSYSKDTFKDVPSNAWYGEALKQLYKSGIMSGEGDRFRPQDPITRAELAGLATRFNPEKFNAKDEGGKDGVFTDVATGQWYANAVSLAAANKWVAGYPDGSFRPNNFITRTETMAIINRVLDRQLTKEKLAELKVQNPYTDIKESDWYYADAIEATVNHRKDRVKWHGLKYNDGKYNVIIEKFVDDKGNVIAKKKTLEGKELKSPKDIVGFDYVGYVKVMTYIYTKGLPQPLVSKTSEGEGKNAKIFQPGDEVTYTIRVQNLKDATRQIEDAKIYDPLPKWTTLVPGSVIVDGKSHKYQLSDYKVGKKDNVELIKPEDQGRQQLEIALGDIAPGKTKVVQFKVLIEKDAYNKKISNFAVLTGKNIKDLGSANLLDPKDNSKKSNDPLPDRHDSIPPGVETHDEGYVVQEGKAYLNVFKASNKKDAKVGDKLKYTIIVETDKTSKTRAKNVEVTDALPVGITFLKGTVEVDGKPTTDYTFKEDTKTLSVKLGDIEKETFKKIEFEAEVNKDAYKTKVKNIAIAKGSNTEPKDSKTIDLNDNPNGGNTNGPGGDGKENNNNGNVVTVDDGKAYLNIDKKVDKTTAKVGDTLTFTVLANTDGKSEIEAKDVVFTDPLPETLDFAGGVTVDGKATSDFSYDEASRVLKVNLGTIKVDQTKKIVFKTTINKKAYDSKITNVGHLEGSNADITTDTTINVTVPQGNANLEIQKVANTTDIKVGQNLDYTITVMNDRNAEVPANNVVVKDKLPAELEFEGMVTIHKVDAQGYNQPGGNAQYKYDTKNKVIEVLAGNLLPGEKAVIVLRTVPNEKAFGKQIFNNATVTSDNANPKEAEVNQPTKVQEGRPDGRFAGKSTNVSKAKPGDTFSYQIEVSNGAAATADWKNITIVDPLPKYLEYVGGFEKDGKGSDESSFDTASNTLTIKPAPIKPGKRHVYKFDVKVLPTAEGETITNIATLNDPENGANGGSSETKLPSTPIVVPEGKPSPYVTKTHDVEKVGDLEYVTYTVEVGNRGNKDNGTWKDVVLNDVLPEETQLVGNPVVHGRSEVDGLSMISGNNIDQPLGDIKSGESVKVSYTVQVRKGTSKVVFYKKGTDAATLEQLKLNNTVRLTNVAKAVGGNGATAGATDNKVKVEPTLVQEGKDGNPGGFRPEGDKPYVEKTVEKDVVDLRGDGKNTYTVKLHNPTSKVWKNTKLVDVLDNKRVTFYADSVTVDGAPRKWGTYEYECSKNTSGYLDSLKISLGDIHPGETVTVQFKVRFNNDGADQPYVNRVTVTSDNERPVKADAPAVSCVNIQPWSFEHVKLMSGYADGKWHPKVGEENMYLSTEEAAAVIGRAITPEHRARLLGGQNPIAASQALPKGFPTTEWYAKPVRYMGSIKALTLKDVDYNHPENKEGRDYYSIKGIKRMVATRDQIGRMLNAVGLPGVAGEDYTTATPNPLDRDTFAAEICKITHRSTKPNVNGKMFNSFSDTKSLLVGEVSTWHRYVLDDNDNEIWVHSDPQKGVDW